MGLNIYKKIYDVFAKTVFDFTCLVQSIRKSEHEYVVIGQSHLDAAWRWRKEQTKNKAWLTFQNALKNVEKYDDYTFSQPAPQYYEWMKLIYPEVFEKIKEAVKTGRWELVGGMWIEPDTNLPDGESLVRQRLLGQLFYKNNFGKISKIEWLPDTFGFAHTLPQIFTKSGAKYFWTNKMDWNDTSVFPFSTFLWQSRDGSQILTHISPFLAQSLIKQKFYNNHNLLLKKGAKLIADYKSYNTIHNNAGLINENFSTEFIPQISVFYGWGDGGHGPKDFEIHFMRTLAAKKRVVLATAKKLFEKLELYRNRLPVWNDEMYLEYHRGCYTTNAKVKHYNRYAEILCQNADIIIALSNMLGCKITDNNDHLHNWKTLLFNQFHDILPGSSIPEVYKDAYKDYRDIITSSENVINRYLKFIAEKIQIREPEIKAAIPYLIFNPLSCNRTEPVFIKSENPEKLSVYNSDGTAIPSQVFKISELKKYLMFVAKNIPGTGYKTYYIREEQHIAKTNYNHLAEYQSDNDIKLENNYIKVLIDHKTGLVKSLINKASSYELINKPSDRLRIFNDKSKKYRAWNIDPDYKQKELTASDEISDLKIIENGDVFAQISFKGRINNSPYQTSIYMFRDLPLLLFSLDIRWYEKEKILRVYFDLNINTDRVAGDIPYGITERPVVPSNIAEKGKWEMPFQKWISLDDSKNGAAIFSMDKYGFSADKNVVGISLLRAPIYPNPIKNAWNLNPDKLRPKYNDQGRHIIFYALYPFTGTYKDEKIWEKAQCFNNRIISMKTAPHNGYLPESSSIINFKSRSSHIGIIKTAEELNNKKDENNIIIRIIEMAHIEDEVSIEFNHGLNIISAFETDLLENNLKEIVPESSTEIKITINPSEIKTIKLIYNNPLHKDI